MADKFPMFGTPGLRSSEGDRLISALCNLWRRIQIMEQSRQSERGNSPNSDNQFEQILMKEISRHENKATQTEQSEPKCDSSLINLQISLLQLQLRYLQYLIRGRRRRQSQSHDNATGSTTNVPSVATSSENNNLDIFSDLDMFPVKLKRDDSSELDKTYTKAEGTNDAMPNLLVANQASQTEAPVLETKVKKTKTAYSFNGPSVDNRFALQQNGKVPNSFSRPSSSRVESESAALPISKSGHYHLKLADVPFILGTVRNSTTSHSLTATAQHIIGALKSHTVFCTSTPKLQQCPQKVSTKFVNTKTLKELGKQFNVLSLEKEKLKQQLAVNKDRSKVKTIQENYKSVTHLLNAKAEEIIEWHERIQSMPSCKFKDVKEVRSHSAPALNTYWRGANDIPVKVVRKGVKK